MSKSWIASKRNEFARDVFRDFCLSAKELDTMFNSYEQTGQISFVDLKQLIGGGMNKGLLWRLKDTSHHLFRNQVSDRLLGRFLDWALGYIFHEAMKLKEDAYQQENYVPWFMSLDRQRIPDAEKIFSNDLMQVLAQTRESVAREVNRIRFIIEQCKHMFPKFYRVQTDNPLLARFLFKQNDLVKSVYGDLYPMLVGTIYDDTPEKMFVLAARSLRQGGWLDDARRAADQALSINPQYEPAISELQALDDPS